MRLAVLAAAGLIGLTIPALAPAQTPAQPCTGAGVKLQFVCNVQKPEDVIQVPGANWVIASGLIDGTKPGGLTLIDPDKHTGTKIAFATGPARAPYAGCPGPLDPAKFSAHGLAILPNGRGKATLFVVGHAGREAIEVFDVTSGTGAPTVKWAGCVPVPAGASVNSTVGLKDGRIVATDYYHAPMTQTDALQGKNTGAVMVWKPGGAWERLAGTELPGPNGVEVSPDGKYLFVAVTGTSSVMRYELADTAKPATKINPNMRTDNLHWAPDGKLLLAGPGANCAAGQTTGCPQGPAVVALDANTLTQTQVLRTAPEPGFPGHAAAVIVGKTLWLGSYAADRVAYTPLEK